MRLPWPFGRRTSADGPPSTGADSGSAGMGHVAGPVTDPADLVAPPTGAWAALPPIQRTVGTAPLVAPAAPFLDGVPGHRPLPPIVTPLGHDTGPSAPPGLVVAHAQPVPSLTSHAAMPTRPVQRHRAHEAAPVAAPDLPEPGAGATSGMPREPEVPAVAGSPVSQDWAPAPVRRVVTVPPAATVTPAAQPLTRAPAAPAPVVSRSSGTRASGASPASRATGPAAPATMPMALREPGLPATSHPAAAGRWPEGMAAVSPSGTPRSPDTTLPAPGPLPRRGAREHPSPPAVTQHDGVAPGAARRAGLGAPITVPPASAVAQRLPVRTPPVVPPRPAVTTSPGQAGADAGADAGPDAGLPARALDAGVAALTSAASRQLPVLPVARRRRDQAADSPADHEPAAPAVPSSTPAATGPGAGTPGRTATPAPGVSRSPGGPVAGAATVSRAPVRPEMRPTLGARPLRPGLTAQREPARPGIPPVTAEPRGVPPVAARWEGHDALPDTVTALSGPAAPAPVPVQLSPGPVAEPAASALVDLPGGRREITFPPRDGGPPEVPGPGTSPASATPRPDTSITPAAVARTTGSPSRGHPPVVARGAEPPLTLARATTATSMTPASAPRTPSANRIVADQPSPAPAPSAQGSSATVAALPVVAATPMVQRVEGTAPAADGQAAEARSETELDELAKALFGRIRTHLRAEVIHDREARGLTFDAF